MLWCDKYRPKKLQQLKCHQRLNLSLRKIIDSATDKESSDASLPHLLLYGPSGAGKRTRIRALLRELFHMPLSASKPFADKHLKLETKEIQCTSSKKITITVLQSAHHIEVTPSDSGVYDRFVISNLVKELAQSVPLNFQQSSDDKASTHSFKVIVLNDVDLLTHQAQAALRRTMEKYMKTCRMILCASSTSNVISPVKSRCLALRVPLPQDDEIIQVLNYIAKEECVTVPPQLTQRIAQAADGNLRRAIMLLESTCAKNDSKKLTPDTFVEKYHWDSYIRLIAKGAALEQSPKRLLETREKLFKLTTNCIPPELILQKLVDYLIEESGNLYGGNYKHTILYAGSLYEHRMKCGSRPLFHMEAFIARYMSGVKAFSAQRPA